MKFLYFTDAHGKGKNPISRIDNYYQSWLLKIEEIIQIAKDTGCCFVVCGGDLFDSPNVSNTIIDDFVDRVEDAELDLYVVPGNHDMGSHNWKLSKGSALAHMSRRSNYIHILDELQFPGEDWFIKGYKYYHDMETDLKKDGLRITGDEAFTIAVPHAFISIKPFFKDVSHICAKDLNTNYDLILCSHFHMSFDETINGTRFLNTNSLGRTAITETHQPEVAIIDTDTREIEKIKLKSAKRADEIFDLAKYEELKANKKDIKEFLNSLKDVNFQSMSVAQQIVKIGKEQKVDQTIVDYLLEKIEENKNG